MTAIGNHNINDIGWMVARFFNRPSVCERGPETPPTEFDEPTAVRKMEYSLYLFGLPTIHSLIPHCQRMFQQ